MMRVLLGTSGALLGAIIGAVLGSELFGFAVGPHLFPNFVWGGYYGLWFAVIDPGNEGTMARMNQVMLASVLVGAGSVGALGAYLALWRHGPAEE